MSIQVMNWVWCNSASGGSDRLILLAIADHASDDGANAYPAVATLARKGNVSERTVQRCIRNLVELGELVVEEPGNGKKANRYRVTMITGSVQTRQDDTLDKGDKDEEPLAVKVTPSAPKGDTDATLTIQEPQTTNHKKPEADASADASVNRRAQLLAAHFVELVPMSRFPAVMSMCKLAITRGGHSDEAVSLALEQIAAEGRSLTVEVLRVQLEGAGVRSTPQNRAPLTARELVERDRQRQRMMG